MATFEIVEQEGMRFVKIGIDKETVQAESGALCAMSGDVTGLPHVAIPRITLESGRSWPASGLAGAQRRPE